MLTTASLPALLLVVLASLAFGVLMVLPIGGADMPVVISLLNAFTGTAVAMAGFVIENWALIIAGALVGASGGILTKLMADAMNRSLGQHHASAASAPATRRSRRRWPATRRSARSPPTTRPSSSPTRPRSSSSPATAWPRRRRSTASPSSRRCSRSHGIEVSYAIHPVAGRMPGHMNVLLAEANVPYPQLKEMDEINPEFAAGRRGARDRRERRDQPGRPPARHRRSPACPSSTSTRRKSIIVVKRSMGTGYAGIDNELYANPKTSMYFADAKKAVAEMTAAVKTLVG